MTDLYTYPVIIIASYLLTELIRRYSLKNNLLDIPNNRSSHKTAVASGGGLSIVIIFFASIGLSHSLPHNIIWAILGAGSLVAFIGFWDDIRGGISIKWRFLSYVIAALWVVLLLGGPHKLQVLGVYMDANWIGISLVTFSLVWLLNLFNFMDGIDGLAASEAIFVSCGGALFTWLNGFEELSFLLLILASSTMGFLILNWAPAKIFMGDTGSLFLGLMLGIIIYSSLLNSMRIWVWIILLGVFIIDSGVTLLTRIYNGERWYEAHCSHAYQHASNKWGHKITTTGVILINIFWLFPFAVFAYLNPDYGVLIALFSYIPLLIVTYKLNAGLSDNN